MSFIKQCILYLLFFPVGLLAQPEVQLAKRFSDSVQASEYFISEKYDGVRAIWTGRELLTRKGNPIHAPRWFIEHLPQVSLDGELWSKRKDFQFVLSTVTKDTPVDAEWRKITYMVFDAPDQEKKETFQQRVANYTRAIHRMNLPHVKPVAQLSVTSNEELKQLLDKYVAEGAEGLMLHRKLARFESGRTDNLLKLKPYMDDEAIVVEVLPGQGKYEGKMGSLLVEMPSGIRFKIGSGFSDEERAHPPIIGDRVTYRYHGLTKNGIPRFASFIRIRNTEN
ncbi:DNA ligase [Marinomonas transparens]|uniref:DNA ligase n=1 Tax=Marinomonas transparens TaxID=2795388 RepID=A0A934JSZ8_9GAMM|nr:DNA ligase [Marinomonas transparens]MBJ7537756.1 DNA ligase [Marinomonas transparens]